VACVVLVHGWSGCRTGPHRILVDAARRLGALGVATLRFDLGGRGESDGHWRECGLDEMIEDASAAADYLRERHPSAPLALWGMCSGANVAIGAATVRRDVDAVVAWSTLPFQTHRGAAADVRRTGGVLRRYAGKLLEAESWRKLIHGRLQWRLILRGLFGHFRRREGPGGRNLKDSRRDIMAEFAGWTGTILFLSGGGDPEAKAARAHYEAFCAEQGIRADFGEVAGANHNFSSLAWKAEALERTIGWLASTLGGEAEPDETEEAGGG
jgi:acetyl esterase/lipase